MSDVEAAYASSESIEQRKLLLGVCGASIAVNLLGAMLATGLWHPGYANPALVLAQFGGAVIMVVGVFYVLLGTKPRKQRVWFVSFDDVGMHVAGNAGPPRAVPWRTIHSVSYTGTMIVLLYGVWRSVYIPRRVYADNGAALCLLLQQKLIGSQSLRRRPDARIIINTAIR